VEIIEIDTMKSSIKILFINILAIACIIIQAHEAMSQNRSFMSYNIRYGSPNDGINNWDNRKLDLVKLIANYNPDIFGTQEGLSHQLSYVDEYLPNYAMIGVARDDGAAKGEYTAIFYDSTIYNIVSNQTFWLSKSPEKVSIGWDAAMERICTYGLFEDKTSNSSIHVFNTHFDHMGKKARVKSAKLILNFIAELPENSSIVLMGDLNSDPNSKPIKLINKKMRDGASQIAPNSLNPKGTFNGFDENMVVDKRIDYIFIRNIDVVGYKHIADRRADGGFISDHIPVLIEVSY